MLAYQYKVMPIELRKYKVSEIADAVDSLDYALEQIEKHAPKPE